MSQQHAKFLEGFAWRDTMPGRPPTLHVTAIWVCPSTGYTLELEPHAPGINPEIVLVLLAETKPTGPVLPVLTPVVTTYHAVARDTVKEVTILPNGPSLAVLDVTLADQPPAAAQFGGGGALFPAANHYEVYADGLAVIYSATSFDGSATLNYNDRVFTGDDVRVEETALGRLVTVELGRDPDGPITYFTLLVPPVRLDEDKAEVKTLGITSVYRTYGGPVIAVGQLQKYEHIGLVGRATLIAS